jgi:hypothetical protein
VAPEMAPFIAVAFITGVATMDAAFCKAFLG